MPFAQFAIDPETVFTVMSEFTVPADQLKAFQENKDGCVIGRKLANEKKLKVGDTLPLEGRCLPGGPEPDGPGHLRRAERIATCGCASSAGTTSTRRSEARSSIRLGLAAAGQRRASRATRA